MADPGNRNPPLPRRSTGRETPTSLDVARLAGVSQSVVSRVFSDRGRVSAAAIAKVRAAAEELGYRPNALARSLITGRSNIIGLVIGELRNPFYPEVIELLSPALQDAGLHLMIFTAPNDGVDTEHVIASILDYKVDGMIMASAAFPDGLADRCIAEGLPVVFFGRGTSDANFSSVTTDGFEGGRLAVRHLLETGRRRIAHIGGNPATSSAVERRAGFEAELAAAGLEAAGIVDGAYTHEGSEAATRTLFGNAHRPDGVFAANDYMAFAAMDTLRFKIGLQVPEDVGVVGFDGVRHAAAAAYDLTTVQQDTGTMVIETVALLAAKRNGEGAGARSVCLAPTLIARGSSRASQSAD